MNRRDIVVQILSEAGASSPQEAEYLFDAMVDKGMISNTGMEEEFSSAEVSRLLDEFREELPGIRRWLCEAGLLGACGHA